MSKQYQRLDSFSPFHIFVFRRHDLPPACLPPYLELLNPVPFPLVICNFYLESPSPVPPQWHHQSGMCLLMLLIPQASGAKSNTIPKPELRSIESEFFALGKTVISQSGMQYRIDRMLQRRMDPVLACVYLATCEHPKVL